MSVNAPLFEQSTGFGVGGGGWHLQQQTFSLPLLHRRGAQNRADGFVKHCLEASLRQRWAFEVFHCACGKHRGNYKAVFHTYSRAASSNPNISQALTSTTAQHPPQTEFRWSQQEPRCSHTDLFRHGEALWVGDGRQLLLLQLFDSVLVIPEIKFGTH